MCISESDPKPAHQGQVFEPPTQKQVKEFRAEQATGLDPHALPEEADSFAREQEQQFQLWREQTGRWRPRAAATASATAPFFARQPVPTEPQLLGTAALRIPLKKVQ